MYGQRPKKDQAASMTLGMPSKPSKALPLAAAAFSGVPAGFCSAWRLAGFSRVSSSSPAPPTRCSPSLL